MPQINSLFRVCILQTRGLSDKCCPKISPKIQDFLDKAVELCKPEHVYICNGSKCEYEIMAKQLCCCGALQPLTKYENCYLARSDPADVARTEGKTYLVTEKERDSIPETKCGVKSILGKWMSPKNAEEVICDLFKKSMEGRTMFVIPYVMGPLDSPFSRAGVELTDSAYVALSMSIMTRMGDAAMERIDTSPRIVKGLHACGKPKKPNLDYPWWPCDPPRTHILHMMERDEIFSYGSGYGGNSLLGKKCYALRFGSKMGQEEGWLAEHMLIVGVEKDGKKKYLGAAFPSACGKTNLAMMSPSLKGMKVTMVGDDIAWIRYCEKTKTLRAVNPEYGLFGVAPGTSEKTNPNAMCAIFNNALFTNVASTSDGGVYWEGMEKPECDVKVTDWLGKPWDPENGKSPAAHPNSRFTVPACQIPNLDPEWESPNGVPISGFIFGGRRSEGMPLVFETNNLAQGLVVGTGVKSEATSAAEHEAGKMMPDPFAMRPFFGYNFAHYLRHWMSFEERIDGFCMPKIFHVNWFLKGKKGEFLWPGFGENARVLEWILNRIEEKEGLAQETPIGWLPNEKGIDSKGMKTSPDMKSLVEFKPEFWLKEVNSIKSFVMEQVPYEYPKELRKELDGMECRIKEHMEKLSGKGKKEDPCRKEKKDDKKKDKKKKDKKKKEDPCRKEKKDDKKKKEDPCRKEKKDDKKKKEDPCRKEKKDDKKKKEDPCRKEKKDDKKKEKKEDPCRKEKKEDKKKEKKEDICKKTEDKKKKEDPCRKEKKDDKKKKDDICKKTEDKKKDDKKKKDLKKKKTTKQGSKLSKTKKPVKKSLHKKTGGEACRDAKKKKDGGTKKKDGEGKKKADPCKKEKGDKKKDHCKK